MKTADLITSFLNNEMTPEQERQFLLSVAASDSMRLSLKSHVMLDRISAGQLHRAQVPVGVREGIFAQMSASMVEPMPGNVPVERPAAHIGGAGGRFAGGLLRRYGNRAMTMLLTVGGFTAGYFAHSELQDPDANPAQQPQQVQMAPAGTSAAPVETPGAQTGSEVRQEGTALMAAPEVTEGQAIAGNAVTGSPAVERERSARVVRQSTARNSVRETQVRSREGISVPRGPLSDPLEPANGLKSTTAPASTAAVGPAASIDSAAQSQPMTIPSVSADGIIKKSTDSQGIQTKQGD